MGRALRGSRLACGGGHTPEHDLARVRSSRHSSIQTHTRSETASRRGADSADAVCRILISHSPMSPERAIVYSITPYAKRFTKPTCEHRTVWETPQSLVHTWEIATWETKLMCTK